MSALVGKKSDFYLTTGAASVALTVEAMTDVSAAVTVPFVARTAYGITNAVKRFWDPTVALVMEESLDSGVTWHAVVPDSVVSAGGRFIFNTSRQASPLAQYRVSGSYMPFSRVGGGHEWTANPMVEILESTEFGATSKTHTVSPLNSGTVQVKRWWLDDSLRTQLIGGAQLGLTLWLDASAQPTGPRWEAFARLKAGAIKSPVAQLLEEDITFELESQLTYISS